jgi:hypothetical protein
MPVAFRLSPKRKRVGFLAASGGDDSAAVLILPKSWRTGAAVVRHLVWPQTGPLEVVGHEGDVFVIDAAPQREGRLRGWIEAHTESERDLLEPLVQVPGIDTATATPTGSLVDILDLLDLYDRCRFGIAEEALPGGGERHILIRLLLYRRTVSALEPLIGKLRPRYYEREDRLGVPRGRILDRSIVESLASRHPTVVCRFDEQSRATELAMVLLAALRAVARFAGTSGTSALFGPAQERAARLSRLLEGVPVLDRRVAFRLSSGIRLNRLEREFDGALRLARTVLRDDLRAPSTVGPEQESFRLSVPTEKLWESILTQALQTAASLLHVRVNADNKPADALTDVPAPWQSPGGSESSQRFPDFLVDVRSAAGSRLWCLDAKYKDLPSGLPLAADANQIFVYSHLAAIDGHGVDECALVYPSSDVAGVRQVLARQRDAALNLAILAAPFPRRSDMASDRAWRDFIAQVRAVLCEAVGAPQAAGLPAHGH